MAEQYLLLAYSMAVNTLTQLRVSKYLAITILQAQMLLTLSRLSLMTLWLSLKFNANAAFPIADLLGNFDIVYTSAGSTEKWCLRC
jgi:hypothetical protein